MARRRMPGGAADDAGAEELEPRRSVQPRVVHGNIRSARAREPLSDKATLSDNECR